MEKIVDEIKYDLNYLKSHTLQPKWFKILKVFILFGFLVGYYALFGITATIIFVVAFILLALVIHMTYRIKTDKYTQSWLDFVVYEENNQLKTKRIGIYYYAAVIISGLLAFVISQVLA